MCGPTGYVDAAMFLARLGCHKSPTTVYPARDEENPDSARIQDATLASCGAYLSWDGCPSSLLLCSRNLADFTALRGRLAGLSLSRQF